MSAEATRRRMSRALDKLRKMLGGSGLNLTPAVLLASMNDLASTAAPPADFATKVVAHAMNPAGATPWCLSMAKQTIHMMQWTTIKLAMAVALAIVASCAAGAAVSAVLDKPTTTSTVQTT